MSNGNEMLEALEGVIKDNPPLQEALINLQREAVAGGWTPKEHGQKVIEILEENDVEIPPEFTLLVAKKSGVKLSDAELGQVAGGFWGSGDDCNKWKDCGNGMGRSCYPHC